MRSTHHYLGFRSDETPVMLVYEYRPGEAPRPWGDYPDPGSLAEVDIISAKDKQGNDIDLTAKERDSFECEILDNHEDPARDFDDERDEQFERDRAVAFWDARDIDF